MCKIKSNLKKAEPPPSQEPREQFPFTDTGEEEIEAYLLTQTKEYLIELILDRAQTDEQWQQQLRLKIAANCVGGTNIDIFRQTLRAAIAVDGYIDYNEVYDYADNIDTVLRELAALVEQQPQVVMDLCEEAMPWLETAMNAVDDSSGYLGDTISDVESLHLTAAQKTKLPPAILAQRLFNLEINSDFGFFHNSLTTYKGVLGQEGLRAYQQIIDAEWQRLADISPKGKRSGRDSFDYRGSQICRLKEQVEKLLKRY